MLRIYPAELSCVSSVYEPVGSRDPFYNSAAIADMTQLDFVVGK